jgi:cell division protein FtsL
MSDASPETKSSSPQPEKAYELDLHTIGKLVFRTSPWLFVTIIAFFATSIAFSIAKYYELKGLITETNHKIELLRTEIKGSVDLLNLKTEMKKGLPQADKRQPQPPN